MRRSHLRTALALALLVGAACRRGPEGPYRHVVVISLDTVRADHLGCYGHERVKTPNIDRLASRGVLFEHALAAAPTTLASHTSLLTGTYPHTHGVVRNGFTIAPENEMLAETLARAGFRTAAFLGSFALDRRFGFDQGFAHFDDRFDIEVDGKMYDQNQRRASAVTDAALAWLEREDPDNAFLFVHYFDAHAPYDPPEPFDRMYARPEGPRAAGAADLDAAVRAQQARTTGAARGLSDVIANGLSRELVCRADGRALSADLDLAALYAGEISYLDREVGRLLDALEERGILQDALVVLTSDHGETAAEHGDYWNHGLWVYDSTLRVPLVVCAPHAGLLAAPGTRVTAPVSSVDVVPTVLALLGLERPPHCEGRALLPLGVSRETHVFGEATQPPVLEEPGQWGNAKKPKCVRSGRWKYVAAPALGLEELYDLERDPEERSNLLSSCASAPGTPAKLSKGDPAAAAALAMLRGELERFARRAKPWPSRFDRSQLDETLRRLEELGYTEGAEGGEEGD